jgi:hypothetical protein
LKLTEEQMEASRKARKEKNPKKKRKIGAVSVVRSSAKRVDTGSGDKLDQVKDLAKRKAAAIASVKATKYVLEALMNPELTLMDKLTPAEAAVKPASKPVPKLTPAPKKKSNFEPLPAAINISATQQVVGGTVRISNALAELRAASVAKKVKEQEDKDAAEALQDTDEE